MEVLRRHQVDGRAGLLEQACGALSNIAFNNADNRIKCGTAGGVEVVVELLRRHQVDGPAGLLEQACWVS